MSDVALRRHIGTRATVAEIGAAKGHERAELPYADDIISMGSELETIDTILKEYELVAGASINADKPVGWQIGSWRSRKMSSESVVRC